MAGKGDKPRDYNRAIVKPHSPEWDTQYKAIFKPKNTTGKDIMKKVIIEVRSGVVKIIKCPKDVEVEIIQRPEQLTEKR